MAFANLEEAVGKLAYSWGVLDHCRPRGTKGYRTAQELEAQLLPWREKVERGVFFEQACKSMKKAVQGGRTAREKRQAERQAVYETLEKFRLVEITRGGKPIKLVPKIREDIL